MQLFSIEKPSYKYVITILNHTTAEPIVHLIRLIEHSATKQEQEAHKLLSLMRLHCPPNKETSSVLPQLIK